MELNPKEHFFFKITENKLGKKGTERLVYIE